MLVTEPPDDARHRAAGHMGRGVVLFTGASAGVKGYPQSAPFAMGRLALRELAQAWRANLWRISHRWSPFYRSLQPADRGGGARHRFMRRRFPRKAD
jgi:hypothetical protein